MTGTVGRCNMRVMPGILSQSDVRHLPIIAAFVKKIGVAEVTPQLD